MRIPSGHQFGSTQAGEHQEARDWRAKLDETFFHHETWSTTPSPKPSFQLRVSSHTPDPPTFSHSVLICFTDLENRDLERPPSFLVGHS